VLDLKNPLVWPADEPRTPFNKKRSTSLFDTPEDKTRRQIENELRLFRATNVSLSYNNAFRGRIDDPAVALYFDLPGGRSIAICCDLYYQRSDNIRALYKVIEAMRTIERYGGQHLSQKSFTGFAALPPPIDIWKSLGISKGVGEALNEKMRREYVMDGFRNKVKEGHGAGNDMAALVDAREEALKQLGVA
jgi:hypothetical protein